MQKFLKVVNIFELKLPFVDLEKSSTFPVEYSLIYIK